MQEKLRGRLVVSRLYLPPRCLEQGWNLARCLANKCSPAVSEACLTMVLIPCAEHCRGVPMFYLYGEAAGCPPVPPLLQALLFQLYPGEFACFSLFFQRFELKTDCAYKNILSLLFQGFFFFFFSLSLPSFSFPFKTFYNTPEEEVGRLCIAFSGANYRHHLE